MKSFTAGPNENGVRLSRFVEGVTKDMPRSMMYKAFRNKRIKVNGKRAEPDTRLSAGDLIELYINDEFFPVGKPAAKTAARRQRSSGKTSPEHFLPTAEKISAVSSKPSVRSKTAAFQFLDLRENGQKPERFWQNPIPSHGEFLMHNTGECPSEENGSFLSQILTEQVPEKYYLSPKACQGILRRASVRGKELPEVLRTALERQACACVTRAENA